MESSKNDDYARIMEKRSLLKMENSELPKELSLHRGEALPLSSRSFLSSTGNTDQQMGQSSALGNLCQMSIQPALAMTIKTLYIHTEENLHLSYIITAEPENTDILSVPTEVLLIPM